MNLNDLKNKATSSTGKSKKEKVTVTVTDETFDENLKEYARLDSEMKALESKIGVVKGELKSTCINTFNEQYQKNGAYPESFNIQSKSGASLMFVPTDKYLKIETPEAFDELLKNWGPEVAFKGYTYSMDPDLFDEFGDQILKAIDKIKDIPQDVKDRLIKAEMVTKVKKGSILKALTYGKGKIADFIRDINPIFQMKNPKTA